MSVLQPFDLNLRHLRALPLIARLRTIRAAAEAANLSQPALTQGLGKIEAQLGLRLFDRHANGMAVTVEGAAFLERAGHALEHLAVATQGRGRGFAQPDRLMTATQLRALLALAAAGSFVEAARAEGWSQPAIHRAVRDLEQISAMLLVERRGRGVMLTAAGRRLARAARLMRSELAAAIEEMLPDAGERGRLVVGAMPLCRARLLPAAITALIRAAPQVTIDVVEGSWRELIDPLRDGEIDMMVGALREERVPIDVTQQPLLRDRVAVVARAGHPLAATQPRLADLTRYPWIVGRPGSPLRAHWQTLFADTPLPPAPIECGSVTTIRGILAASDCLTLLSPAQVAVEVAAGLLTPVLLDAEGMDRTIGLTTRSDWRPSKIQARFIAALQAAART